MDDREGVMQSNYPDKQAVRQYMADRSTNENPPESPEEIRRTLGWHLCPENGYVPEVSD